LVYLLHPALAAQAHREIGMSQSQLPRGPWVAERQITRHQTEGKQK
jgi:hypothetical protein